MGANRNTWQERTQIEYQRAVRRKRIIRSFTWMAGIVAACVAATATGFGTGIAQHLLNTLFSYEPGGRPIQIDSVTYEEGGRGRADGTYVFARKLGLSAAQIKALNHIPKSNPRYDQWFKSRGGVESGSVIKIVVQGNRQHPVQIIDMRPVDHCGRPLKGTLFATQPPGGSLAVTGLSFDLDLARPQPMNYLMPGDYFDTHTISLKDGESWTFRAVVTTTRYHCSYYLAMTVVDGTRTIQEVVNDHGKDFQISAVVTAFSSMAPARTRMHGGGMYSYYKALYVSKGFTYQNRPFVAENPLTYEPVPAADIRAATGR